MPANRTAVIAVLLSAATLRAQSAPNELILRAMQSPNDEQIIAEVASAFRDAKDPAIFAQLRELFLVVTEKHLRGKLGILMFATLGQKDDLYFDALAKYAQDAVDSGAPPLYLVDAEGNESRGNFTLAFAQWCDAHRLKQDVCLAAVAEQVEGLIPLTYLKDRRAIPIFRQGLKSENVAMVMLSAGGLAVLNDADSIPLIVTAARRFPPKLQSQVAQTLAEFDDPRAWPPLDELIKDPKFRQELTDSIRLRLAQPAGK